MMRRATTLPDLTQYQVPPQRDGNSADECFSTQPVERPAAPDEMTGAERCRLRALVERRLGGGDLQDFLTDMDRIESDLVATYGQDWH